VKVHRGQGNVTKAKRRHLGTVDWRVYLCVHVAQVRHPLMGRTTACLLGATRHWQVREEGGTLAVLSNVGRRLGSSSQAVEPDGGVVVHHLHVALHA